MITYPMSFFTTASSKSGTSTLWTTNAKTESKIITMAIPPEFAGPGQGNSPEDLYAMALQNCFIATFKVFAEKSKLNYESIQVESELIVDRDDKGRPWMSKVKLNITLESPQNIDNAKRILEKTSQNCMILNSVKTDKEFHFVIR